MRLDHLEQRVWLAVDPMGMKPLYVRSRRDGVSFSSEAMPIARFFGDTEPETLASPLFRILGLLTRRPVGHWGIERMAPGEVRVHDCSGQEISAGDSPEVLERTHLVERRRRRIRGSQWICI